jgi:transposase-like protein
MGQKTPSPILAELRRASGNEALAVEFMEQHRWGSDPACPRCGDMDVYQMKGADGRRNADYRWRCRGCKRMFTVRTGTILEESRLPVRVWLLAFWRACASKKGISALQLSREAEITHRSALFVLRRIRYAMSDPAPVQKLAGIVEIDETYVGGRPRAKGQPKEKAAVVAMAERGGDVRFFTMERVTAATVGRAIEENVDLRSRLMTDEAAIYTGLGEFFGGGHHTVKHSAGEYSKPGTDIHSNSVEGVFSLLKRGIYGTFHSVSKRHLGNYLSEFEFRHNARRIDDGQRIARAIKKADGKRLTYRDAVEAPPWMPRR